MVAVSIIIPCYNQAAYVGKAVDSALAQTCADYEIILVNDGSTDATEQVFTNLKAAHTGRIQSVSQTNQGLSMARQAGLDRAAGEYIVFLDSDDQLLPGMLAACLAGFKRHPDAGAIVGRTNVVYENHPERSRILSPGGNDRWPEILAVNPFGSPCSMMLKKKAVLDAGGPGLPGVRACEDWDLYARMIRRGVRFERIPDVLACYLQHENVLSRDIELMLGEKVRMLERLVGAADCALHGSYQNGYVMFALGQAVGRRCEISALSGILSRAVACQVRFRFYCNQFLYGLQHSVALTAAALDNGYIDRVCGLVADNFPGDRQIASMFTREIRREMRNPMQQRSVARRFSRLLDPLRNAWIRAHH